jgi:hypothetical protein
MRALLALGSVDAAQGAAHASSKRGKLVLIKNTF